MTQFATVHNVMAFDDETKHDPSNGQFTSGGGSGSKDPAREGGSNSPEAKAERIRRAGKQPAGESGSSYTHSYNPESVNKGIEAAGRYGPKIGKREANNIHRLLKGRHGGDETMDAEPCSPRGDLAAELKSRQVARDAAACTSTQASSGKPVSFKFAEDDETKHDPSNGQFTGSGGGGVTKGDFQTNSESSWTDNAKSRGHTVKQNLTRPNGDVTPGYHKAHDKNGNLKGTFDDKRVPKGVLGL